MVNEAIVQSTDTGSYCMKALTKVLLSAGLLASFVAFPAPASAKIHPEMFCWVTDVEVPVGCSEDEEEPDGDER
jgi:hypothetical protein